MKRVDNLWSEIVSDDNMKEAQRRASSKGKKKRRTAMQFLSDSSNLKELQRDMAEGTYTTSEYRCFTRREGAKIRDLAALPFKDRIAQWAVMLQVAPVFTKTFIPQTYASIPGRGQHRALDKLHSYMRDTGAKYYLQMDVDDFFNQINHELLKDKIRRIFKDPMVVGFFCNVIDSFGTDVGVPKGNLTSQWLGNLYLSGIDHYFKEKFHAKWYIRFLDDIVILGWKKSWLRRALKRMQTLLAELGLKLNTNYRIAPVTEGIDFLGYRSFPGYTLLRKRVKNNLKTAMKTLKTILIVDSTYNPDCHDMGRWSAYKGVLDHCDGYRLASRTTIPVGKMLLERINHGMHEIEEFGKAGAKDHRSRGGHTVLQRGREDESRRRDWTGRDILRIRLLPPIHR